MLSDFAGLGLDPNWIPAITCLVALPTFYVYLSIDAHKDCAAVMAALAGRTPHPSPASKAKMIALMDNALTLFRLEWWIIAAFGILIAGIMATGYIPDLAIAISPSAAHTAGPVQHPSSVRGAMSLYATGIGLLVGFRLFWERMTLAMKMREYYAHCSFGW